MEKNGVFKNKIAKETVGSNDSVSVRRCSIDGRSVLVPVKYNTDLKCSVVIERCVVEDLHSRSEERVNSSEVKKEGVTSSSNYQTVLSGSPKFDLNTMSSLKPSFKEVPRKASKNVRVTKRRKLALARRRHMSKLLSREENSTNSDISESNGLYDEINWEENLEVDTSSLIDEFAPRPPVVSPNAENNMNVKVEVKEEIIPLSNQPEIQDPQDAFEFVPGSEVQVQDYNCSDWQLATIMEVDWEEEEVLVHFHDSTKSDEWVSMRSQRLHQNQVTDTTAIESVPEPSPVPQIVHIKEEDFPEASEREEKPVKVVERKEVPKISRLPRNKFQRRFRRHPRKNFQTSSRGSSKNLMRDRYFEVGEKVLAKWSEHRMQKFPAVIKRVLGNGTYDVLFYDGFEKTLSKDDLFKTTEEEVEKYKKSNPSEADSFVDMDIGSKEERRQKKRKTFDDYLFVNSFERSKKRRHALQSEIGRPSTSKPSKGSESGPFDDSKSPHTLQSLTVQGRQIKRRRKLLIEKSLKEVRMSEKPPETPRKESGYDEKLTVKVEDTSVCEYSSEHTLSAETSISLEEGTEPKKVPVTDLRTDGERWIGDIPSGALPTVISGIDGIPRKSVIIPDKNLPSGWMKHGVMRQSGGSWEAFLVSPEGYRFHSLQKLKDYFRVTKQSDPPQVLDFKLCLRALPELVLKQKDLSAKGTYQKWEKKRGRQRKLNEDSSGGSRARPLGRVKTLLPKYRLPVQHPQAHPPPSGLVNQGEGEDWRCPKQGCDKKFRNENLLQMHIKHYHVELKALVRAAPKVEDLAYARTESANADWMVEQAKTPQSTIKRMLPKQGPRTSFSDKDQEHPVTPSTSSLAPQTSSQATPYSKTETISSEDSIIKRQLSTPVEEKKSTIKTIFPLRHTTVESSSKSVIESDNGESEEDGNLSESQKLPSTSRGYKLHRNKKIKVDQNFPSTGAPLDDIGMRDHGYPMYSGSRLIKKKQIPALDKLQITTDSNDSYTEEEKVSPNTDTYEEAPHIERLKSEELINCTCGFKEEDGLMIQCDICLCWQHGLCNGIEKETDVPDRYVCCICRSPYRVRASKKYSYAQIYLTQAKLPSLSFRTVKEDDMKHRESMLKRCYDLSENLHRIQNVERSVRAKINIAEQPDHPKLYLWAKNWDDNANIKSESKESVGVKRQPTEIETQSDENPENGVKAGAPVPEAAIDLEECRLKLMDHIELYQQHVESRLTTLETQIAALEAQDPDLASQETSENYPHTKRTIHMLLRDLGTIRKVGAIS